MDQRVPKYKIGTTFYTRGKNKRIATVIDILRTFNNDNVLIKFRYVAKYQSILNEIIDYDVCEATISMRLINAMV